MEASGLLTDRCEDFRGHRIVPRVAINDLFGGLFVKPIAKFPLERDDVLGHLSEVLAFEEVHCHKVVLVRDTQTLASVDVSVDVLLPTV